MLTVRVFYKDGTETVLDVNDVSEICLDNVENIRIIRNEKAA